MQSTPELAAGGISPTIDIGILHDFGVDIHSSGVGSIFPHYVNMYICNAVHFTTPPGRILSAVQVVVKQLDSVEFYEMNWLNESLSMNVFCLRGMAFIPNKAEPNIGRESDASTYTGVHCVDINSKLGTC
jgi:hypothetical protein